MTFEHVGIAATILTSISIVIFVALSFFRGYATTAGVKQQIDAHEKALSKLLEIHVESLQSSISSNKELIGIVREEIAGRFDMQDTSLKHISTNVQHCTVRLDALYAIFTSPFNPNQSRDP